MDPLKREALKADASRQMAEARARGRLVFKRVDRDMRQLALLLDPTRHKDTG